MGHKVVFTNDFYAESKTWTRKDQGLTEDAGTESGDNTPFFSVEGRNIAVHRIAVRMYSSFAIHALFMCVFRGFQMSGHSFPDEIIYEILSPALKVDDEMFSDTSDVSPFATYSESSSAYLLVCKAWLRVATPLLYSVVILRSKAQATALSQVLSKNEQFGLIIKKLRVEGGYGPPMHTILQHTPNISDLFVSLIIWESDSTAGLCQGLPLINPRRLIVRDAEGYRFMTNKMGRDLEDALVASIPKWDRLVRSLTMNIIKS